MADSMPVLLALELLDDSEIKVDEFFDDSDDVILLSVACCFMRRHLNRVPNSFETTIPSYFPDEFKSHFRMTRQTFELFAQEVMTTGRIPIGNSPGRAPIPQMEHSYIKSLHSAILSLKAMYRRAVLGTTNLSNGKGNFGPTGQSGPPSKLVPNIPVGPNRNDSFHLMYQPKLPEFWVEWKAPTDSFSLLLPPFVSLYVPVVYINF